MSSSNFKMFRRFSTPSSAGLGIADLYEHSDKMEYLHKCDHCGYWNLMDYADYIDDGDPNSGGNVRQMIKDGVDVAGRIVMPGTFDYVCKKCGKHLDRWYNGSWVSRFPERTANLDGIRGYRISQLNCVWINTRVQTFGCGQ